MYSEPTSAELVETLRSTYDLGLSLAILDNDLSWMDDDEPHPVGAVLFRAMDQLDPNGSIKDQVEKEILLRRKQRGAPEEKTARHEKIAIINDVMMSILSTKVRSREPIPPRFKAILLEYELGI